MRLYALTDVVESFGEARRQLLLVQNFKVGDNVEARYRAGRYFKGRIRTVHTTDGTFDVDYDDGDKERGVDVSFIRKLV